MRVNDVQRLDLLSVRMRASRMVDGEPHHVSGAERITPSADVLSVVQAMAKRALTHPLGPADNVNIALERVTNFAVSSAMPIISVTASSPAEGRSLAADALIASGVAAEVALGAISAIAAGPAPGGRNMRGAMIVCAKTGRRLEADSARGVRATRMDYSGAMRAHLLKVLSAVTTDPQRTMEALCVASKIVGHVGAMAEYCCSDDPDYPGGYVCTRAHGYMRIDTLKAVGEGKGGRAIFVDGADPDKLARAVETDVVLFDMFPGMSAVLECASARRHLHDPSQTPLTSAFGD